MRVLAGVLAAVAVGGVMMTCGAGAEAGAQAGVQAGEAGLSAAQRAQDGRLRLNQIQVIGTHNSYHTGFAPSEAKWLQAHNAKAFAGLDYAHKTLTEQLDAGVRQVEIDIYGDAKGGRFANPAIVGLVAKDGLPADPPVDPEGVLGRPGFKVLHVAGLDLRSSCLTLVRCLTEIRTWSAAHPAHVPVFVLLETKYDKAGAQRPAWAPALEDWTPEAFDRMDAEIRSVFQAGETVLPDAVRGAHATLPEAIAAGGWPTLAASRGKVVFLMDQASMTPVYTEGHAALKGRVVFTNGTQGTADAAFVEQNSGTVEAINALVAQGYLVRTRTDEPTEQARTNDTRRRDEVMGSGAQMLSTDYPWNEPARWAGHYSVELPEGRTMRCDPVNKPAGCVDALVAGPGVVQGPK